MPACKTPGPLCGYGNSNRFHEGAERRLGFAAPGPTGAWTASKPGPASHVHTLVLDQDRILHLLGSVAYAKALERHTKLEWKPYTESPVLNAIYAVLPFGTPGTAEVESGDVRKVQEEAQADAEHLVEAFAAALARGPEPTVRFLQAQQEIRESCLETVSGVYRDAAALNRAVQDAVRTAVARLAVIKAASTITLKTAALTGGGVPAFLIGTGYDLALKFIEDWDQAPQAQLLGVTTKGADKLWKQGVKKAAKNAAYMMEGEAAAPRHKAEWLEKRLAAMQRDLESEATAERLRKFARDGRRLARAQQEAAHAERWAAALSSVKYVFFAWDAYKAAADTAHILGTQGYHGAWEAVRDIGPHFDRD